MIQLVQEVELGEGWEMMGFDYSKPRGHIVKKFRMRQEFYGYREFSSKHGLKDEQPYPF
mgnify:CR=1 FL=1